MFEEFFEFYFVFVFDVDFEYFVLYFVVDDVVCCCVLFLEVFDEGVYFFGFCVVFFMYVFDLVGIYVVGFEFFVDEFFD